MIDLFFVGVGEVALELVFVLEEEAFELAEVPESLAAGFLNETLISGAE